MKRSSLVKYTRSLLIALLAVLLSSIAYQARMVKTDGYSYAEQLQQALIEQKENTNRILNDFITKHQSTAGKSIRDPEYLEKLERKYKQDGIILVLYEDETLDFWSHNALPLLNRRPPGKTSGVVQKQNGWYYYTSQEADKQIYVAYYHLKKEFKYQNKFLVNTFQKNLPELSRQFYISERPTDGYKIVDEKSNYLFSLVLRREAALYKSLPFIYFISLISGIAAYLIFIYFSFRYFSRLFHVGKRATAIAGFIFALLFVRIISFWL